MNITNTYKKGELHAFLQISFKKPWPMHDLKRAGLIYNDIPTQIWEVF